MTSQLRTPSTTAATYPHADRLAVRLAEGPFRQATDEEAWQVAVHNLMRAGFGTEDIAHQLGCTLGDVEEERDLLRAEGRLDGLYTGRLPVEAPSDPEDGRQSGLDRLAADIAWASRAKRQMQEKGLLRARKACPHCAGRVRLEIVGSHRHVRALCETPLCLKVIE